MELPPFGRVDNVDDLDLEPIVVPIVGYTLDKTEVQEKFRFRPVSPAGASLEIIRHTDINGNVPLGVVIKFLDKCVLDDDLEAWREFLDRGDVMIENGVLIEIYKAITEVYGDRPTLPSSGSDGGGSTTRRTSQGAARAKASASRKSR